MYNLQDIDEALRRHCGVPVRRYFVAAAPDDGTPCTFVSGGHKLPENVIAQFFDASKFQQVMNRLDAGKFFLTASSRVQLLTLR